MERKAASASHSFALSRLLEKRASCIGGVDGIIDAAFSMRFIGDDVRYIDRGGETSPPFTGINLKSGDNLRVDWFPVVWSR